MPKFPRHVRKRDGRYEFRAKAHGQTFFKDLGHEPREMRRLARFAEEELEVLRASGKPTGGTVAAFADRWLADYIPRHRPKEKGQRLAEARLRKYILPPLGQFQMPEVQRIHFEGFATSLRESGLAVNTQRHILSDVRCLFNYAVELGEIAFSPFGKRILPRAPRGAPQPIPDADLATILEIIPEPFNAAIRLARSTGLRWGEQRDRQWRHVEFGPKPVLIVDETKDGGWRRVPLNDEAVDILTRWRATTSSVYVMPWRPQAPSWPPRLTLRLCGIRWHWHQLRHTFACRYLRSPEGTIEALSKLLGHASVTTTERYADLDEASVHAEYRRVFGAKVGREVGRDI